MALRIALFGQAAFAKDVLVGLVEQGHSIVGVYAPPEGARPDPLAVEAAERGFPLIRHKRFRRRGEAIPERVEEHAKLAAELNVLAFVTVILPQEIVDAPPHGSLCFHPSLLPRFRGGSALAWQIMLGEQESGVTVFRPDAGVDTGPIVVQRGGVPIRDTDTGGSLYFERLYPLGVEALLEAVAAVDSGTAQYRDQDESQASFQGLVGEADARIDWSRSAVELDRQVRGCDPQPGAWAERDGQALRLYDGRLLPGGAEAPPGTVLGLEEGRLLLAARGGRLSIGRLRCGDGPKQPAPEVGLSGGDRLS
jgi:methionyl-tRNA formyltransferase